VGVKNVSSGNRKPSPGQVATSNPPYLSLCPEPERLSSVPIKPEDKVADQRCFKDDQAAGITCFPPPAAGEWLESLIPFGGFLLETPLGLKKPTRVEQPNPVWAFFGRLCRVFFIQASEHCACNSPYAIALAKQLSVDKIINFRNIQRREVGRSSAEHVT
jgi:hypothetical protein